VHPQFIITAKEKFAMATTLELVAPKPGIGFLPVVPITPGRNKPSKYSGGYGQHHFRLSFSSRSSCPLRHFVISSASEMTFIVSFSGLGKSTIAHLLQAMMYEPEKGNIDFDEWGM